MMKVDAYASSILSVYALCVLDCAICAFGHGAYPPRTTHQTELALLIAQVLTRVLLLALTANLVAWAASSYGSIMDALMSYKGAFVMHIFALISCLVLRVYRIMLSSSVALVATHAKLGAAMVSVSVSGAEAPFGVPCAELIPSHTRRRYYTDFPTLRYQWKQPLHVVLYITYVSTSLMLYYVCSSAVMRLGSLSARFGGAKGTHRGSRSTSSCSAGWR